MEYIKTLSLLFSRKRWLKPNFMNIQTLNSCVLCRLPALQIHALKVKRRGYNFVTLFFIFLSIPITILILQYNIANHHKEDNCPTASIALVIFPPE